MADTSAPPPGPSAPAEAIPPHTRLPASPAPAAAPGPLPEQPLLRPSEWALLGSAYLSQTVAFSFFFVSLSTILRTQGAALDDIGWLYLLGLLPGLKFLWAPLMDRIGFGQLGHYTAWLVLMQACLIGTLVFMALLPVGAGQPLPMGALVAGCVALAFFTACQDMAADGLSVRLLSPRQRGLGNAVQMACGAVGFIAAGGGVLTLYEHHGWTVALLSLVSLNLVTLLLALFYREPPHARPAPHGPAHLAGYWRGLARFWQRPDTGWAWLVLILFLQSGVYLAYSVLTPMLVDSGWTPSRIGQVVNLYGTLVGMASMLGLGVVMKRWSPTVALQVMLPAQGVAVVALAAPLLLRADAIWVTLGVGLYMAIYMPMGVLVSTLMMSRASAHAPATDFSMQYGVYLCAGYGFGALGLPLAQRLGYDTVLGLALGINLLLWVGVPLLWRRVNMQGRNN